MHYQGLIENYGDLYNKGTVTSTYWAMWVLGEGVTNNMETGAICNFGIFDVYRIFGAPILNNYGVIYQICPGVSQLIAEIGGTGTITAIDICNYLPRVSRH